MSTTGQLSFQLYKWLSSLQIITSSQKYQSNGNIKLESKIYQDLLSGQLMAKLVQTLASQMRVQLNGPLLSSIKKSNTPASRVYNWNVLSDTFNKIGVSLSKQMQKQITSDSFYKYRGRWHQKYFLIKFKKNQKSQPQKQQPSDNIDFNKIQKYKTYQECQNVIEAIIRMISKTCSLTSKQAFSTLAQNLKYFSHMIVKGIKNSYDQIIAFFKTLIQNMPHLMYLAEKDPAAITSFLLQICKPSLISRQPEVALYGSRSLAALIYESMKYNEKNLVYQILSGQNAGFDFIYMGIKRHPHLMTQYIEFIHPLIEKSYKQFFELHLKNIINNQAQYIRTIIIFLEGIKHMQESKVSVIECGLLKNWVRMCEDSFTISSNRKQVVISNPSQEQARILTLQLMCDLWKIFSTQLDQKQAQQQLLKGIQQLKKNTRKDNYLIKFSALNRLFDFLDFLANQKNRLAAIVYKKTIFLLFQNHQDLQLRQIILQNFSLILKKFPTIPIQFLLEPLLRQLIKQEGVSYILNVFDFEFFIEVFKHPKIQAQWALNYLEYFTKLYTKNIIYSGIVIRIIQLLCSRFCEQETIMEYIIKNVDNGLNVYGMLAIGKKTYVKGREQKLMNSQKKSLIIQLLKYYIKLQNQFINNSIKSKVLKLYVSWIDTKHHNDKGLYSLLSLFGDVEELVMKQRIQKQNINLKQSSFQKSSINKAKYSASTQKQRMPNSASYSSPKAFSPFTDSPQIQKKYHQKNQKSQQIDSWREDLLLQPSQYNSQATEIKRKTYKRNSQKIMKPQTVDSKTLQDIELYKMRKRRQSQKKKEQLDRSSQLQIVPKVNQTQLIARQISLGYNKIFKPEQLFYEFDSVKTKYLKQQTQMIDLQELQDRDISSTNTILKRYQKQIQILFYKYTAVGTVNNRSPTQQKVFMSFTDLNRMLKQKNLNKLPKIVINQIITFINKKKKYNMNVLVGVQQKQFPQFLILFTNLYAKQDKLDKDQPFGFKIQKILMRLFQGQWFSKDLNDKKANQWFKNNKIQILEFQQQQRIQIPEGYKKVINQEPIQQYLIKQAVEFQLSQSYKTCLEVLNQIFKERLKFDIFPSYAKTNKITRIIPIVKAPKPKIPQVLTQKALKKPVQKLQDSSIDGDNAINEVSKTNILKPKSTTKREQLYKMPAISRSKSQKDVIIKKVNKTQIPNQDEIQKKHKQQQEYAKKLRQQLEAIRKVKQKKDQQQKQKKQLEYKQKLKKLQQHKKYIQQNKKKIQQKKDKQQQQRLQNKQKQQEEKQRKKQQIKQKQKSLLEKMQKHIQQKKQQFQQKVKSKQKQLKKLQNLAKINKTVNQSQKQPNAEKERQNKLNQQIKNGNTLLPLLSKFDPQIKILFEEYWNWKTKKIQLKQIALMMKNFKVSPQYLSPKILSETFKAHGKGDALPIQQFKNLLIKYCYKSQKLQQQLKANTGKQFQPQQLRIFLEQKLYMKQFNYVQTIKKAKLQKL